MPGGVGPQAAAWGCVWGQPSPSPPSGILYLIWVFLNKTASQRQPSSPSLSLQPCCLTEPASCSQSCHPGPRGSGTQTSAARVPDGSSPGVGEAALPRPGLWFCIRWGSGGRISAGSCRCLGWAPGCFSPGRSPEHSPGATAALPARRSGRSRSHRRPAGGGLGPGGGSGNRIRPGPVWGGAGRRRPPPRYGSAPCPGLGRTRARVPETQHRVCSTPRCRAPRDTSPEPSPPDDPSTPGRGSPAAPRPFRGERVCPETGTTRSCTGTPGCCLSPGANGDPQLLQPGALPGTAPAPAPGLRGWAGPEAAVMAAAHPSCRPLPRTRGGGTPAPPLPHRPARSRGPRQRGGVGVWREAGAVATGTRRASPAPPAPL